MKMNRYTIEKSVSETTKVKLENDGYCTQLLTTKNGNQWGGCGMNRELAKQAILVLQEYIDKKDDEYYDKTKL